MVLIYLMYAGECGKIGNEEEIIEQLVGISANQSKMGTLRVQW